MTKPATTLLACAACSQEMQCNDEGTLPLHQSPDSALSTQHSTLTCPGSYGMGQPSRSGPMIRPPYVPTQIDEAAANEAWESKQCWACGAHKRRGYAFCKECSKAVKPVEVYVRLRGGPGEGFVEALAAGLISLGDQHAAGQSPLFFGSLESNVSGPPNSRV